VPLAFRNLTITPDAPVTDWPTEAIQTALERGDLRDWRRIAAVIKRDPWGPTARQVEEVLSHSRPYGISELMETVIARARARTEQGERAEVAKEIQRAIDQSGLSRAEFAARIGTSSSRLSTYVSGKVTPSAALLVRIRRLLRHLGVIDDRHSGSAIGMRRRRGAAMSNQEAGPAIGRPNSNDDFEGLMKELPSGPLPEAAERSLWLNQVIAARIVQDPNGRWTSHGGIWLPWKLTQA
jgi:transcriptional regulator with XRE-family HTH domain